MSVPHWEPIALTFEQLQSYKALCSQATTGPWKMVTRTWKPNIIGLTHFGEKMEPATHFTVITGWVHGQLEAPVSIVQEMSSPFYERQTWAELLPQDAAFIAAARSGWPKTLEAYERKEDALNIACAVLRGNQQWFEDAGQGNLAAVCSNILAIVRELTTVVEGYEPAEAINRFLSGAVAGRPDPADPGSSPRPDVPNGDIL